MKISLTKEELNKIVSKHYGCNVEEVIIENASNDGWISNVGRDKYGTPETLPQDTTIEIELRNRKTFIGYAYSWDVVWRETDNDPHDIVAYRVLKG